MQKGDALTPFSNTTATYPSILQYLRKAEGEEDANRRCATLTGTIREKELGGW